MRASVVIDASLWVSHIVPLDANHAASRLWINRYRRLGGLLVAPDLLIIEVAAAVSRRTGQPAVGHGAVQNLLSVGDVSLVPMQTSFIEEAARIAADLQLRTGDAIYVALAHQLNIPLVGWDNQQLQRGRTLVETYTPDDYPF